MASKYRVGVIGRTGKGNYGHGLDRVWLDVPETEVVSVADEHDGGRADTAKKLGAKSSYADYREMLDAEQLDIVAVATRWIDTHHEMTLAALEHGCHVYTEKPFCRTLQEADELVQACERKHLKLAIAHNNRYSPVVHQLKTLVEQGEIGELLEVRARGKEDRRGGGEDLWVLGTHMLDLSRMFAGDVKSCFAYVMADGHSVGPSDVYEGNEGIGPLAGDAIEAIYHFHNGITGFFASHRDRGGQPSRFALQLFGSKGVAEIPSGYNVTCYLLKDSSWSPGRTASKWQPVSAEGIGQPAKGPSGSGAANIAAVKDLIEAIETDRPTISNEYDARAATEMIVGVFEAHRQGCKVGFPLENRENPLTMLEG